MNKKKLTSFFINQRENRFKGLFRILLQIVSFSLLFLFIVVSTFKLSGILEIENSVLGWMMSECFFLLVALGITFLLGKYVDKRRWNKFGFKFNKQAVIDYFFGVIITGVVVCLSIFIMVKFSTLNIEKVRGLNWQLLYVLVSCICIGIYMELLRSYQVLNLSESLAWKDYFTPKGAAIMAVIISAFLFSAGELIGTESAVNLFLYFMRALMLAGGYVFTRNLALSIGLHTGYNIFRDNIFSYQGEGAFLLGKNIVFDKKRTPWYNFGVANQKTKEVITNELYPK